MGLPTILNPTCCNIGTPPWIFYLVNFVHACAENSWWFLKQQDAKSTCQVDSLLPRLYIYISLYNIYIYIYTYLGNQHARISTQWNASKYLIWSRVTPGSHILSVFVFLTLIKAQRITLNNWKAMKNNEK